MIFNAVKYFKSHQQSTKVEILILKTHATFTVE